MELLSQMCLLLLCGFTFVNGDGAAVIGAKEDGDVDFPCSLRPGGDFEFWMYDWKKGDHMEVLMYDEGLTHDTGFTVPDTQFVGRVSYLEDQLGSGAPSINITKTNKSDSWNYSCEFSDREWNQRVFIELVVECNLKETTVENRQGQRPFVGSKNDTEVRALLQCPVNSSGNILRTEEEETTEAAVTKIDHYSCVVTREICADDRLRIVKCYRSAPILLYIFIICVVLIFAIAVALCVLCAKRRICCKKDEKSESMESML
ncbi:butyrophilin subfamily 2 member A2-like isoform X1 [Xyrichtys novacula]|uniref:Butyrophilin subfamily 2 member A2-like isoform X1 n=1 Tax=Xyrichtys novacula TaxID=13765 RepID=A0AAV1H714_XYRNO|nr:butyrophilin subfamily 2 member A2-like isoform X1 [Xyrichtys novacula]